MLLKWRRDEKEFSLSDLQRSSRLEKRTKNSACLSSVDEMLYLEMKMRWRENLKRKAELQLQVKICFGVLNGLLQLFFGVGRDLTPLDVDGVQGLIESKDGTKRGKAEISDQWM